MEKEKKSKVCRKIIRLYVIEEKSIREIAEELNMEILQICTILYDMNLVKRKIRPIRSGMKEVQEYFKNQISCGERIQLKKRISGEGKDYCCFYGTVIHIYPNFFQIQYENNGWYECFLYTDLFTREILIEKRKENEILEKRGIAKNILSE